MKTYLCMYELTYNGNFAISSISAGTYIKESTVLSVSADLHFSADKILICLTHEAKVRLDSLSMTTSKSCLIQLIVCRCKAPFCGFKVCQLSVGFLLDFTGFWYY